MADNKTQANQSLVMALPELKMVLVHAKNESQNVVEDGLLGESSADQFDKKKAVRKIIRHLESTEQ